jgi:MFS transporter, SP family, galactose:H+ symporter
MELSEQSNTAHSRQFVYFIAMICAINGLLFGYDTGVISGVILFIDNEFKLSVSAQSVIMIAVLIGACVSAAFSGSLADKFGRRKMLYVDAVLFIIGTILSVSTGGVIGLIIGRLVVGLAIGISSYVAPLYVSEIAFFKNRGSLVAMFQLFITIGIFVSYSINYFFSFGEHWRWMLGMGIIPGFLLFISLFYMPESPRWLISKGYYDKAREILQKVRRSYDVEKELLEIQGVVSSQRDSWRMLFKGWLLPVVLIGFGIAALQQLVGINSIIYFVPLVLKASGFAHATNALLATSGIGAVLVLFTVFAIILLDRWGRRPLLIVGLAGMSISLIMISILFFHSSTEAISHGKWYLLTCILVYIASFAISLGPIGWLIISEIFPLRIRGLASSLAAATIWGFDILVTGTFLPLVKLVSFGGAFLLYGILCIIGFVLILYFMPETNGISLEHIESNLRQGKRCRDLGGK